MIVSGAKTGLMGERRGFEGLMKVGAVFIIYPLTPGVYETTLSFQEVSTDLRVP